MNFGQAVTLAKSGHKIARAGWNGQGMWVAYVDSWMVGHVSLFDDYPWLPFLIIKTTDDKFVPWAASQADILAEDWDVL